MTNNKMSLGEKVGLGVAVVGLAGYLSALVTAPKGYSEKYLALNEEKAIVRELDFLKSGKKLSVEDAVLEEKYFALNKEYTVRLEDKLQVLRTSPQYNTEKQKREENESSQLNHLLFTLFSALVMGAGIVYSIKKQRLRQQSQEAQTTPGAPQ